MASILRRKGFDMSPFFGRKNNPRISNALLPRQCSAFVQQLEERRLLAIDVDWSPGSGKLTVTGTNGTDELYVRNTGGFVNVEGLNGSVVHWSGSSDSVTPSMVYSIEIVGTNNLGFADGADKINLESVTIAHGFINITGTTLNGGAGNDSITGSAFPDLIIGHKGNDTLHCGDGDDTVLGSGDGGEGFDSIKGEGGNDSLHGGSQGDFLDGGNGSDILVAGDGSEGHDLHGGAGNDTITGSNSATGDTIFGGAGDDVLQGGNGSDAYVFAGTNLGNDTINEDADQASDWLDFSSFAGGSVSLDLNRTDEQSVGSGTKLTLSTSTSMEDVTGTTSSDTITGNGRPNWLEGNDGADLLSGLGGDDTFDGGVGNDTLVGGSGSDTYLFQGTGRGSDSITEEAGADADRLDFSGFGAGIATLNLSLGTGSVQNVGGSTSITLSNSQGIEDVIGTAHSDVILGNSRPNIISGGGGNDSLTAGEGDDRLSGEDGNDTIVAGIGNDSLFAGAGDDLFRADLIAGNANIFTDTSAGEDSLTVNLPAGTAGQTVSIDLDSVNFTNGAVNFADIVRLILVAADGADTVIVHQPEIGALPAQLQVVGNGGNDSITLLLSTSPLTTEFSVNAGLGTNQLEVRGTANADYFALVSGTLDVASGSRVVISDVAQLILDAQGGNDQVSLRDTSLSGTITVLGGNDPDRIELISPDAGSFVLSGDAGDDTIVVRSPLASGTTVHGGSHVAGDVLDVSHNNLSAANLPVLFATVETVDLSYNAFTEAPTLYSGVHTADLRYNSLGDLSRLAPITSLRTILLHGNTNSPNFTPLRGRLFKTDLPAVGLQKAERLPNAEDALMEVAKALHFSPVEIYEYVLNNFEFQPYDGLMKGVRGTLLTHAGNSWDLSELLIGLLNQAGTSLVNMSFETSRVVLPFEKARAWLGVETDSTALKLLSDSQSGLGSVYSASLGGFIIDHAWVAVNFAGVGGPASIALDPSWKFREYRPGIPGILADLPFAVGANSLESQYLSTVKSQLPHEWYEDRIAEYLREHEPGKGLADVGRNGPIRAQAFAELPDYLSGLQLANPSTPTSANPATQTYSHTASFLSHHDAAGPELFTHRIQIHFVNAEPITRQVRQVAFEPIYVTWIHGTIEFLNNIYDTYQPIVHIGTETIVLSTVYNDIPFAGIEPKVSVRVKLFEPGTSTAGTPAHEAEYLRQLGTIMGIGIAANQTNDVTLAERQAVLNDYANSHNVSNFGEVGVGQLLAQAAATYFRRHEQAQDLVDSYAHTVRSRNHVEAAMTSSTSEVFLRPDMQNPFVPVGLFIDVKDGVMFHSFDIYSPSNVRTEVDNTRDQVMSRTRSALEHAVWEEFVNAESVSSIKALQIANHDSGDNNTVLVLSSGTTGLAGILSTLVSNYGTAFGTKIVGDSNDTFTSFTIWGFLNAGATVRVHNQLISLGGGSWVGVGFLADKVGGLGIEFRAAVVHDTTGSSGLGGGTSRYENFYTLPQLTPQSHIAGDPVNVSTGAVYEDVVDIEIPRPGLPLNFARHYDSSSSLDRGLGEGWTHTYSHFLSFNPAGEPTGTVAWTDDQAVRTVFRPNGSGGYVVPDTRRGEFRRIPASGGTPEHYIWRDKTGFTLEFEATAGALTKISDRNGNQISLQYMAAQYGGPVRLHTVTHNARSGGLTFEYNSGDDRFDRIEDNAGREWQYNLNDGLLREVISPSSSSTLDARFQYTYYATTVLDPSHHKLQEVTQPDGGKITYRYYPNGRAFQVIDPEGYVQTFQYDQHKNEARFIDENQQTTLYVYNVGGSLEREVQPDRATTHTLWNNGLVRERIGANGISEAYDYLGAGGENERLGNVTAIRRFLRYGGSAHPITDLFDGSNPPRNMQVDELFSYQSLHEGGNPSNPFLVSVMTSSTDRVGTVTNFGYDLKGNVTGITRAVGQSEQNTTSMTYFTNGLLETVTYPRGTASSGVADDFKTIYTHDVSGSGNVATTTTWISTGVTAVETFQYDSFGLGHLNEYTDANNHRTLYTNDLLGRRIVEVRPEQFVGQPAIDRTWRTKYYRNGLVEMTTEPNGRTAALDDRSVVYTYDLRQLPVSTTYVPPTGDPTDRVTTVAGHDAIRNVAFQTDGRGNLTRFDYDSRNRMVRTIYADGATELVTYNGVGQPLVTIDALGRRTKFEYDTLGRMVQRTDPDPDGLGSPIWKYRYDDLGNTIAVIDPLNSRTDTTYDRLSRVASVLFVDPDNAGPLLRRRITNTYYEDGDLKALSEDVPNTGLPVRRTEFDIDGLHRRTVERFKDGGPSGTQLYSTVTTYDKVGNVKAATDRLGHTTDFDYNDRNELVTMTQPAPFGGGAETRPVWQYAYDANGNRTLETDPRGNKTRNSYDRMNRVVLSERLDANNLVQSASGVAYDAVGNVVATIDPLGRSTFREFDKRNRLVESFDAMLTSTKTTYDLTGNVLITIVSAGSGQLERPTLYEYDKLNRLIRRVDSDPDGGGADYVSPQWRYEYDKLGNVTKVIDPLLHATQYTYDRLSRQTEEKDALNQISKTTYDNFGNVAKTDDRRGRSFSYEYNALDQVTHTRQLRYPGGGTQILVGHVVTIYDANGNLLDEAVDVLDLSDLGNVHSVATRHTTYGYDALDRRTSVTNNEGKSWITTYDKAGNVLAESDPNVPQSRRTEFGYDALNRPTERRIMNGASVLSTWTTAYDAAGNVLTETDPLSQATTSKYDRLNREVRTTDARGFVTVNQFDPFGNHTAIVDAAGNTTRWTYDALDRLQSEQQFTSAGVLVGGTLSYVYDAVSNLKRKTDRRNNTTLYHYNDLNRLTTEEWRVGGTFEGTPVRSIGYEYDPDGRLTRVGDTGYAPGQATLYEFDFDGAGRVNQSNYTGPFGLSKIETSSDYFSDGQLDRRITKYQPVGGTSTILDAITTYDAVGRLRSVVQTGSSVDASPMELVFGYNAAGDLTSVERFNGATSVGSSVYTYSHPAGWLTSVAHFGLQGAIAAYNQNYRPDGSVSSLGRTATTDAGTYAYTYDATNQLIGVNHSGSNDESYGYDGTGNRTSSSAPGLATNYQTDALNRVIDDGTYHYTYDADGNQSSRTHKTTGEYTAYGWDHRNRLRSIANFTSVGGLKTSHVEYLYDYRDLRIARFNDTESVDVQPQPLPSVKHFFYNDLNEVVFELFDNDAGGSNKADVTHRYVYGPLVDQVLLDEADLVGGGREMRWTLADHQGTVRDLASNAGLPLERRTFDTFGRITSDSNSAIDELFGYTGQEYDAAVDLYYYNARWYDADTGRFLSQDPARDDINPYRYVGNDAVNATDPAGLAARSLSGPSGGYEGLFPTQQRAVAWASGIGLGGGGGLGLGFGGGSRSAPMDVSPPVASLPPSGLPTGVRAPAAWFNNLSAAQKRSTTELAGLSLGMNTGTAGIGAAIAAPFISGLGATMFSDPGRFYDNVAPKSAAPHGWMEMARDQLQVQVQGMLGTLQGGTNIVNGLQDTGIGILNLPALAVNGLAYLNEQVGILDANQSVRVPYIPSPDWSRGLITAEGGSPGSWTDTHAWSKFLGATGVEILSGAWLGKTSTAQKAVTVADSVATESSIARAERLGRAGEAAAGITGRKVGVQGPISGKMRFPDQLTTTVLKEVKNVARQGLTAQIKDYIAIAQQARIPFELWVRASGTKLSKPLQAAIQRKEVVLKLNTGT